MNFRKSDCKSASFGIFKRISMLDGGCIRYFLARRLKNVARAGVWVVAQLNNMWSIDLFASPHSHSADSKIPMRCKCSPDLTWPNLNRLIVTISLRLRSVSLNQGVLLIKECIVEKRQP